MSTKIIVGAGAGPKHKLPISFKRMDREKLRVVEAYVPHDLALLICAFAKPVPLPFNYWSLWKEVPEYNSSGTYGHLPMCSTELPGW